MVFNTDAEEFGGAGASPKSYKSEKEHMHGFDNSISMTLAPLSVMYLKSTARKKTVKSEETVSKTSEKKNRSTTRRKKAAADENKSV